MAEKSGAPQTLIETDLLDEVLTTLTPILIDTADGSRDTKPPNEDSKVVMSSSLHSEAPLAQASSSDPGRRWLSQDQPVC